MPTLYNVTTKKPEELDGPALQEALLRGTHAYPKGSEVAGYDAENNPVNIPAKNLAQALASGYKVQTPTQRAVDEYVSENKGLKGALKVGLGQAVDEFALGLPELIYDKTADPLEVAKKEALKKEHEFANLVGGVTGAGAGMFVGAPAFKSVGKVGEKAAALTAEKLGVKAGEEVGKRTLARAGKEILAKTVGGAAEGALLSAPHAITEVALGDPDDAAESVLAGGMIGAFFGGNVQAAKELLGFGKRGVKSAMEKIAQAKGEGFDPLAKTAKVLAGVDENNFNHYRANKERIDLTPPPEKEGIKDLIDDAYRSFNEKASIAKDNLMQAETRLKEGYAGLKHDLAQTRPPETLASELLASQQEMKARLGEMSDELYDALGRTNKELDTSSLKKFIDKQMRGLKVTDEAAVVGDVAKAEYARLGQLRSDLDTFPKKLTMNEAKELIKKLDPDLNFDYGAGEFNVFKDRHGKDFRKFINSEIRGSSPEVDLLLDDMSRRSSILKDINKKAGTPEKAASFLKNMTGEKAKLNKSLLADFEILAEKDFTSQLAEYEKAKDFLTRSKLKDLHEELTPGLKKELDQARSAYEKALSELEPLKRLSEGRSWNTIKQFGYKNPNPEIRKSLEALSEATGQDFVTMIKDRNALDAFTKDSTNGSRKTLLGTMVGSVFGPLGAQVGAVAGAVLDPYGGAFAKNAFDGLLFVEQRMKKAALKLEEIPKILDRMSTKGLPPAKTASLEAIRRILGEENPHKKGSREDRVQKLEELRDKASIYAGNPNHQAEKISTYSSALSTRGAPKIGEAFSSKLSQAYSYLFQEMPKPPRPRSPFAPKEVYRPTDSELSAFEQKASVVQDPFIVLEELEAGTLTQNHMSALKAVYPGLHRMIQEKVQKAVISGVKPLPYQKRVKLSLLMEAPMDTSLMRESVQGYQKTFLMPEEKEKPLGELPSISGAQSEVSKLLT